MALIKVKDVKISIHALREEGDYGFFVDVLCYICISIHALREEGDCSRSSSSVETAEFLSTPSARRATGNTRTYRMVTMHFYPRPPRGGRPGQ